MDLSAHPRSSSKSRLQHAGRAARKLVFSKLPCEAVGDRRDDMPPAVLDPVIEFEQMMYGLVLFSKTRKYGPPSER